MATLVRGYIDQGPYADNPLFGAPFALNTGWSSTGNDLHVWILSALGMISSDPFTVLAIYFFATFPLSAVTMYWLCRKYGVAKPAAVMAGVLFSVVPGHQERFPHLFLAAYWAVPFAAWLILETAGGRSVLAARSSGTRSGRLQELTPPVLMVFALGLGDVYYVAFTLVIAAPVIALRQLRRRSLAELGALSVPLVLLVTPTLVSIAIARRRADRDAITGGMPFGRTFLDSGRWAGQIIDLVLPWPGHRVPALGQRTQAYDALTGTTGEVSAIGAVALLGIVGVMLASGTALLRGRLAVMDPLLAAITVAVVISLAFFTRGGLGALTAFLVTPQIRTWSRLFLFLALFGLLALSRFVTRLDRRADGGRRVVAVSVLLLLLGVLDQTSPARAPDYAGNRARLAGLTDFDDRIQQSLGSGCTVFVLPIVGFPEVNDDLWPDLMSLGLASKDLRWSFGAIKGTAPADWQLGLSSDDGQRMVDDLASLDFCGVVVESSLTQRVPTLAAQIPRILGRPVAVSGDQRYTAYDLREARRELESKVGGAGLRARSEASLHPVIATLGGAWALDEAAGRRYPLGPGPTIAISNMASKAVDVRLNLTLLGAASGESRLLLKGLGEQSETVSIPPRARRTLAFNVKAPPGASTVMILRADGAPEWNALAAPVHLASVEALAISAADATVNVGTDLPSP
jgi:hypothetical protein